MSATVCPTCLGDRTVVKPRMAMLANKIGTVNVEEPCKTCRGTGYLPGIKPLV